MKQRAFTLIELLVVIAIIAILAAILFPVFASAKLAAKKASTISNIKQTSLGLIMYCADVDDYFPMAEYGDSDPNYPHITWTTTTYPYVKNGDQAIDANGQKVSTGKDGVYKDVAGPNLDTKDASVEGYYFGVNRLICADDYDGGQPWFNGNGQVINSMSQTEIDAPADKILVATKGLNNPSDKWNYPWFVDWQFQYIDSIAHTPGDASTVYRDGDISQQPGSAVYSPVYDTDCTSTSSGAWECAAHPRYRYSGVGVFGYSDGHSKAIRRGAVQWFKNIYVQRGGITSASWTYGWYYPQEPF